MEINRDNALATQPASCNGSLFVSPLGSTKECCNTTG